MEGDFVNMKIAAVMNMFDATPKKTSQERGL